MRVSIQTKNGMPVVGSQPVERCVQLHDVGRKQYKVATRQSFVFNHVPDEQDFDLNDRK